MEDKITVIELDIDSSKVTEIAQEWAAETKFSIHEQNGRRIVYIKKVRLVWAWLVIEKLATKVKLSAWVGAKNLGPDEKGSFWKGNKVPIPNGFAFGPAGVYQKYFNRLLGMINSISNGTSVISPMQNANPQMLSKDNFAKGLALLGIIDFLSGALGVYTTTSLVDNHLFPDLGRGLLQDGIVDMVIGTVLFFCSRLLKNGKVLSIWLYGVAVLVTVGHEIVKGAGFPFFPILFGVWITSQLMGLKKQGQLT